MLGYSAKLFDRAGVDGVPKGRGKGDKRVRRATEVWGAITQDTINEAILSMPRR